MPSAASSSMTGRATDMPRPPSGVKEAHPNPGPPIGGRRLRQMLTVFATGSIGLVALIGAGQLLLRPGLRPTDLIATFEAQTEVGIFNQRLGVEPGKVQFTEDEYRARIAEAERTGQAKAELVFQKEIAAVQADKERVVGAYQTLYQRSNLIAQAAVQLETVAMQFRQQLLMQSNGGRATVIGVHDMLCALGMEESCRAAQSQRQNMVAESTSLSEGSVQKRVRDMFSGLPDPASFVVREDSKRHGTPRIER